MIKLKFLIKGNFFHSISVSNLEHFEGLLGVDLNGRIAVIRKFKDYKFDSFQLFYDYQIAFLMEIYSWDLLLELSNEEFMIPGLIDTHIHAPQYCFTGTGYDLSLLHWLETYTFPKEAMFNDLNFAKDCYSKVVGKTLSNGTIFLNSGTTTASYYATTHTESSLLLAQICNKLGQRAFIGKVNMDRNSPKYYCETTEESISETLRFIERMKSVNYELIYPIITPRFAPSCSPELMQELVNIAKSSNLPIQSHMSETREEIEWVKQLFPGLNDYASVYDSFGILNQNSIMAHCIHMSDSEIKLLMDRNVGISHCPNSNFSLQSGVLNIQKLIGLGFHKIGLGTDCAGGYSPSILDSMRQALIASKVVYLQHGSLKPINFSQVFHLATLGGAQCLGLDSKIGNFSIGKQFDAIRIDLSQQTTENDPFRNSNGDCRVAIVDIFQHDTAMNRFEKFIYLGDDRNMTEIYVNGSRVL